MPRLQDALNEFVPYPPALTVSPLANELSMLGALLLAYQSLPMPIPGLRLPTTTNAGDRNPIVAPEPARTGA
jgi:hypothetical protein